MIANLFFNKNFSTAGHKIISNIPPGNIDHAVRIFCKQDSIDSGATLRLTSSSVVNLESLQVLLTGEIENYKILTLISGKKVFLQLKPSSSGEAGNKFLDLQFEYLRQVSISGSLYLSEKNLKHVFKILGHPIDDLDDFIDENHIQALEKIIYRKISGPPPNFSDSILLVPDRDLQMLLNNILHKNIASADMLASYIYGLGDGGQILLDNLSKSVRTYVMGKIKLARLKSTYRWAEEVKYIIHRNLYTAAKELEISIKGLEALDFISRSFEINVAKHLLQVKSVSEWLSDFDRESRIQTILSEIRRKVLTEALTFEEWENVSGIFKKYISKEGVELLREDVEFSRSVPQEKRFLSLAKFYRKVKDITYTPLVGEMDFEKEVMGKISGGGEVDLIVDEIGFAKAVFALKNMPPGWVNSILSGPLLNIYEDVLERKMKINKYEDYRIAECRREFLKTLLILCDEDKI